MGLIAKVLKYRGVVTPPTTITRVWNPGHYIRCSSGTDNLPVDGPPMLSTNVKGFMKFYNWKLLEPQLDQYDGLDSVTGIVAKDLQWCLDNGARLFLIITDRTYGNTNPAPPYFGTPTDEFIDGLPGNPYIQHYNNQITGKSDGSVMVRWNQSGTYNVRVRIKKLIDQIAALCDGHPAFEGFGLQETAMGFSVNQKQALGYTPQVYADYYSDVLTYASAAMPSSRIVFTMNFFPDGATMGHAGEFVDSTLAAIEPLHSCIFSGPDCFPENAGLRNEAYNYHDSGTFTIGGVLCHGYKNKIPMSIQVSPPSYGQQWSKDPVPARYWTCQEIFDFANATASWKGNALNSSYTFWYKAGANANNALPDLGPPYQSWSVGPAGTAAGSAKSIVATNGAFFNYTGPK